MMSRYIAFDVETPNSRNDRMSAIGLSVIEDGRIVRDYYTLVDPQTHFDSFNIELTGITPELVQGAPTFPELWRTLQPILDSGLLIAHNAPFDMGVLAKCLRAYGLSWRPWADYACTCQMSRRLLPQLPNHRLNTLCDRLGIPLDHHRADSDSRACARLLLCYLESGADIRPFIRRYDLTAGRTVSRI